MKNLMRLGVLLVVGMVAVAGGGGCSSDDTGESGGACGELGDNGTLAKGAGITSCNGKYLFINQLDGNVVLYHAPSAVQGSAAWSSNTVGNGGTLTLTAGELVLRDASGKELFRSGTSGHSGAKFTMQDDGNGVIYDASGVAIWATSTVAGGSGGSGGGCRSNSDCHDKCQRCELSTGSCRSKLTC